MSRLRRGSLHRQRDERRYDLHSLQLRHILERRYERDLQALLGREVVSEWSICLQRLRTGQSSGRRRLEQLSALRHR